MYRILVLLQGKKKYVLGGQDVYSVEIRNMSRQEEKNTPRKTQVSV